MQNHPEQGLHQESVWGPRSSLEEAGEWGTGQGLRAKGPLVEEAHEPKGWKEAEEEKLSLGQGPDQRGHAAEDLRSF